MDSELISPSIGFEPDTPTQLASESDLHALIEANLYPLFGYQLIASELRLYGGQLRVDTFALSCDMRPVIIEYKKGLCDTAIEQAIAYRDAIIKDRPSFALSVLRANVPVETVRWDEPIILCIASAFSRHVVDSLRYIKADISLVAYRDSDACQVLLKNIASTVKGSRPAKPASNAISSVATDTLDSLLTAIREEFNDIHLAERNEDISIGYLNVFAKIDKSGRKSKNIIVEFYLSPDEVGIHPSLVTKTKDGFRIKKYNEKKKDFVLSIIRTCYETATNQL